ncbi:hypothetical protein [Mediterranea massiliensis]|uniref:hypothetical protein n=1 Tax=Mediterranea massiliensis TaxID=1841865 RepID=UPI0025A31F70|nr:hypothetical protein [Mediterranea massiliensis]MDM8336517.1 hypothetical protein [Mediterranea massiliensis]
MRGLRVWSYGVTLRSGYAVTVAPLFLSVVIRLICVIRVPIPAGDETRHATSLQGCALPADHYHPLCYLSVVIRPIRVIRVPIPCGQ